MELIILSDSHGLTEELAIIKNRHQGVNAFIHCGDSELDANSPFLQGMYVVRGNCDYDKNLPLEHIIDLDSERIYVTHGHLNQVKQTLMPLTYKAQEVNATICCFGHSHLLGVEKINQCLFINPGSIRLPRGRNEKTYIYLQKQGEKYLVTVYELNGKILEKHEI